MYKNLGKSIRLINYLIIKQNGLTVRIIPGTRITI